MQVTYNSKLHNMNQWRCAALSSGSVAAAGFGTSASWNASISTRPTRRLGKRLSHQHQQHLFGHRSAAPGSAAGDYCALSGGQSWHLRQRGQPADFLGISATPFFSDSKTKGSNVAFVGELGVNETIDITRNFFVRCRLQPDLHLQRARAPDQLDFTDTPHQ